MDENASRISSVLTTNIKGTKSTALRDLQVSNDKLHKENERKESKILSLTKELQATRASQQEHQNKFRLLTGSFELLQGEKVTLTNDLVKLKKQFDEMRKKQLHLSDASKLAQQLQEWTKENSELLAQQSVLQAEITLKDERMRTLQYEVDVAHRAIQVQNKYESSGNNHSLPGSLGTNRELLRSLYFDLGKAAADNHALTLSLANSEQAQQSMKVSLESCQDENKTLKTQLEDLEITLTAKDNTIRDQNLLITCLQEQLDDVQQQLVNKGRAMEVVVRERDDVKERYVLLDRDYARLDIQLQQLTHNHQGLTSKYDTSQAQVASLTQRMEAEREVLLEEVSRLRTIEQTHAQTVAEHGTLQENHRTLEDKYNSLDHQYRELRANQHLHDHQQQAMSEQVQGRDLLLAQEQDKYRTVLAERDTLATALTKAMSLVRQLTERCEEESKQKKEMEKQLVETCKVKEEMTQAVVQALHEERQKAHDLASALMHLRNVNNTAGSTNTTSVTVSALPLTLPPPPLSATQNVHDYNWLRRDAQIDQQVRSVYNNPPLMQQNQPLSNYNAALQRVSSASTSVSSSTAHSHNNNANPPGMMTPVSHHSHISNNNNPTLQVTVEHLTPVSTPYRSNTANNNQHPEQLFATSATAPSNFTAINASNGTTTVIFRDAILNELSRLNDEIRSILPVPQSVVASTATSMSSSASTQMQVLHPSLQQPSLQHPQNTQNPSQSEYYRPQEPPQYSHQEQQQQVVYASRQPLHPQDITNNTTFYSSGNNNNNNNSGSYQTNPSYNQSVTSLPVQTSYEPDYRQSQSNSMSTSRYTNVPPEWEALAQTLRVPT